MIDSLLLDQGMQCIDSGADKVDIMSIVSHLRQDRHGSVETADQYRFIYQVIIVVDLCRLNGLEDLQ